MRGRSWITILLWLGACAHGPEKDPKQARVHYQIGLSYLEDQKYPEALKEFEDAARFDPSDPALHMHVGIAYLQLEKIDEAAKWVSEACKMPEPFPECWNNLSHIELRRGHAAEAASYAEKALATDTYSTPETAFANLARAQLALKQPQKALTTLQKSLRLKPQACDLRILLNPTYIRLNDLETALSEARRTKFFCRLEPQAHLWEAYLLQKIGRRSDAEQKYREIMELFRQPETIDASRVALERLKKRLPLPEPRS